ncbi:MAG TPA: SgcJ/EcaC family oxidoreductase [Dongiaceae bacterium]|nr:SgcJ/EcaC family oxidoreductase [Dongiaceae bacterium]
MTETDDARRAIREIVEDLVAAWNRHDAVGFSRRFAPDADFTNVFGMALKGREAIERAHAAIFATIFKDSRLSAQETEIRFVRPDVAAVDVRWTMTGARDLDGEDWPDRRGLLNLLATQEGGAWSIAVSHNMDLPPAELGQKQAALTARTAKP